jgi:3-methylcrotonyl-CoA carboxylase alpha subunit
LLVANRGEIACRVMKSARRLGLTTIAVYSEADAEARHVALADEAQLIGLAPAAESYLNIEAVIAAACAAGAEAVHPGYGFLSENADFAEACTAAGLIFVGPSPQAIRAMGSKIKAKEIMAKAGVPLVPGYHGADQSDEALAAAAEATGFPLLIKASAGGGGKGMRVVEAAEDFAEALAGARREALGAFGDAEVLLEKYLQRPRHIEIQVFADHQGAVVHLFERDCSLQRRHQKVLEEAPAPGIDPAERAAMGAAAVAAAKAIDYLGAGTVEFIVEAGAFHFMEMNTRLQVEHPVTEMVTGIDLVEWQLRVAAGEALPLTQEKIALEGHAVEARIYAEDPAKGFLPASGDLKVLQYPAEGEGLRVDAGAAAGEAITPHYDPMFAKVIAWGPDRRAALTRLRRGLAELRVVGVKTNGAFLHALVSHPDVQAGPVDTGFIARNAAALMPPEGPVPDEVLALAALAELLRHSAEAKAQAVRSNDPFSPFNLVTGWRINVETHSSITFHDSDGEKTVIVHYRPEGYRFGLPGGEILVRGRLQEDGRLRAELDGRWLTASVFWGEGTLAVFLGAELHVLRCHDPLALDSEVPAGSDRLLAPMPGRVVEIKVAQGDRVEAGRALLVMEAMKMEHTVIAPVEGQVKEIHVAEGDLVEDGAELIAFEPEEA